MARRQWGNRARSGPSHPTARSRYLGMHLGSGRGFQSGVAPAANAPRGFPVPSLPPLQCRRTVRDWAISNGVAPAATLRSANQSRRHRQSARLALRQKAKHWKDSVAHGEGGAIV